MLRNPVRTRILTLLAVGLLGGAAACSAPEPALDEVASTYVGHVHGLGVDPADGVLYVAAHGGVFRVVDGRLSLVAGRSQDTMGFTVVGPGHFLASGHPAPTEDRPPHLGLIESRDAADTWASLSLAGSADFHSLEQGKDALYGFDSRSQTLLRSRDRRTWQPVARGSFADLAAHPTENGVVLATSAKGLLRVEGDGPPTVLAAPKGLTYLAWPGPRELVGVTAAGRLYASPDAGSTWEARGQLPGEVEAFQAGSDGWYAASDEGLFTSTDAGTTWTRLL